MTDRDSAGMIGRAYGERSKPVRRSIKRYAVELKRRIVEETFNPGESVSIVARRYDVNANLVFAWRQKYHRGELGQGAAEIGGAPPDFIPVGVVTSGAAVKPLLLPAPSSKVQRASVPPAVLESGHRSGKIEISLRGGIKVRVDAGIDEAALRRVLTVIREVA